MKRPTLEQLDFLYVILQIIGIFLLGIIFKKDINSRDEWIGKNEINIQKYSATVLSCTKKNQRNMYYEIEVELSTGKLLGHQAGILGNSIAEMKALLKREPKENRQAYSECMFAFSCICAILCV